MGTIVAISPQPVLRFVDNNGNALVGGQLFTYQSGTTTPEATYTDDTGDTQNTNPIILNARGEAQVWLLPSQTYRFVLATATDTNPPQSPIWTVDGIISSGNIAVGNMTDELGSNGHPGFSAANGDFTPGTTTSLTLANSYGSAPNLWVAFDAAEQGADTYSLNAKTLTFNAPIPVGVSKVFVKGGTSLTVGTPANGTVFDITVAPGTKLYNRINDFIDLRDPAYGAICNGTTDDTAAVNLAIAAIGSTAATLIIPGPTLISGNVTFGANTTLWFLNSGSFVGKVGTEVVTVQRQIEAGLTQIFSNCAPIASTGQNVYPEWFGAARNGATSDTAAFNLAYGYLKNTGGQILMAPGNYASAAAISAQYDAIALIGAGLEITTITVTSTTVDGIDCVGTSSDILNAPVFQGFSLNCSSQTTVGAGINLQYTALAKVTDVQVNGFINGVNMLKATNTFLTRVGASYAGSVSNFIGFNINGGGATAGGNESSVWRDCYVQGSGSSGTSCIAYRAYGAYVSDLYFDNCASAECNYGWELDYSSATANGYADVTLVNPVVDGFTLQGILANQVPTGQKLSIIGGWINPASTGAETDDIYITGSGGQVSIGGGIQLQGDNNHAHAVGVRVINSNNVQVGEAQFGNCNYGIEETGSGYNKYGGSYWNANGNNATACIAMTGSSRSMVVGASFQGYATVGVSADNTSTGVGVVGCTFNASTVSTAVSNLSTGPIGGSDGTTGLNSGA